MTAAEPYSARRRAAPRLERVAFKTSRLAEFCSQRELVAQTGHAIEDWPLVTLKELVDNALDECEEARIAPEIDITVSTETGEVSIADNGRGIPAPVVRDVLDYSYRVSSREAYVSPTRGAQGNALKTLIAMPFAPTAASG
jgi:DNA topoisomerase VI subunit B